MPLNLLSMPILRDLTRRLFPVARSNKCDDTTTSPSQAHGMIAPSTATVLSPIYRLPPELIDMIFLYLPASSAIAFRRCNKHLYIDGGPESLDLLYSRLCNEENRDDHLWLLCLLERDAPQRLACSICITMHNKKYFSTAEMSKPSTNRRCRTLRVCPHNDNSLTFPQIQQIASEYSRFHSKPRTPLGCTFAVCAPRKPNGKRAGEDCGITWSYNQVWKRGLYLSISWVVPLGCICQRRFSYSLIWSWRLCPHVFMKDCCPCCTSGVRWDDPFGGESYRIQNGWYLRCESCCTEISRAEATVRGGRVAVVMVKRYLGRGKSVEDADWIRQTTP